MGDEVLQLAVALAVLVVVAIVWLSVIFMPGRTLERWRAERRDDDSE